MKKIVASLLVIVAFASTMIGCNNGGGRLANEVDSLSYVVGLNVGVELMKMDSTLNADAVCRAIKDVFEERQKMSIEEARDYYLGQKTYFVHEKAMAYQEQYLADLSKSDREYVRLRNGVTYKILTLGDQSIQSLISRDTLTLSITLRDEANNLIIENDTLRSSYNDLLDGLREVVRITGNGGKVSAWLPSATAYGSVGNEEKGVVADQLLNFTVDIVDIKYHNKKNRQ